MAVVGMVCDATTTGYRALRQKALASMTMARPRPRTREMARPTPVTAMVAGRWTVNSTTRSSQSRRRICSGVGRM